MIRPHLWFCRVLPFMHADRGCELAPGLPCALCILRDMFWHSSGELRREMADVCFLGCLKIDVEECDHTRVGTAQGRAQPVRIFCS